VPFFVRIGVIGANQSGIGSRGWYIWRRQERVLVRWGAVEVETDGSQTRFSCGPGWPKEICYVESSLESAIDLVRRKTAEKIGASEGSGRYTKLPPGTGIRNAGRRR
jgi:hypothetical protein